VSIKFINYSALEKCKIKEINGVDVIDVECYDKNSKDMPIASLRPGTTYSQDTGVQIIQSDEFRKIAIYIATTRNRFYYELIYKTESDRLITWAYRIQKKVDGKFVTIYRTDSDTDSDSEKKWGESFKIHPEILSMKF
jgi:hypothetical protein